MKSHNKKICLMFSLISFLFLVNVAFADPAYYDNYDDSKILSSRIKDYQERIDKVGESLKNMVFSLPGPLEEAYIDTKYKEALYLLEESVKSLERNDFDGARQYLIEIHQIRNFLEGHTDKKPHIIDLITRLEDDGILRITGKVKYPARGISKIFCSILDEEKRIIRKAHIFISAGPKDRIKPFTMSLMGFYSSSDYSVKLDLNSTESEK